MGRIGTRLARGAVRIAIAGAVLWTIVSLPLPQRRDDEVMLIRVPVAVFLFVVYVGKTLYDTFYQLR